MTLADLDWGSVPAWFTTVTAIVGSGLAIRQLALARSAQESQVQIARANLLLAIDREFESAETYESRKAVRSLSNKAEAIVRSRGPRDLSPDSLRDEVAIEFSHQLNEIWQVAKNIREPDAKGEDAAVADASSQYAQLMVLPYWIETVAMLCRKNLLPTDDVLELYDAVVIRTMTQFNKHIETRIRDIPFENAFLLENARSFLPDAEAHYKRKREPVKAPDSGSRLKWIPVKRTGV